MPEQFSNLASTTLSGNYTSGSGSISVTSATGFPTSGTFSVTILNGTSVVLIFRVTSVSGTTFTGAAEGPDSNASAGFTVVGTMLTTAAMGQIRSDTNQFGTRSSLPSTTGQLKGNVYHCTDSPYEFVFDGSVWQPYVFGYNVVEPILANFTQVNINTGVNVTLDTSHGGINFFGISQGSSENCGYLAQAVPGSGAYDVDLAFYNLSPSGNGGFGVGLSAGTLTSNKFALSAWPWQSASFNNWEEKEYNTCTSHNTDNGDVQVAVTSPLIWMRVNDDRTTNRTWYMSHNGQNWIQLFQQSRTTNFTPAFGIACMVPFNVNVQAHLVHFSIHT